MELMHEAYRTEPLMHEAYRTEPLLLLIHYLPYQRLTHHLPYQRQRLMYQQQRLIAHEHQRQRLIAHELAYGRHRRPSARLALHAYQRH